MENRKLIEKTVRENPGISFSELKRKTGLANGVLQYHVRKSEDVVKRKGALMEPDACESCELSGLCRDTCLKRETRKPVKRKILEGLNKGKSQAEIAEELDRDRSTVSYHVSLMREQGLIQDGKVVKPV